MRIQFARLETLIAKVQVEEKHSCLLLNISVDCCPLSCSPICFYSPLIFRKVLAAYKALLLTS